MTEYNKSLEEKIDRLEYYIDLLRDYIVDQEKFILWEWAISNRLNRDEVRSIIEIPKVYNQRIKKLQTIKKTRNFLNLFLKLIKYLLLINQMKLKQWMKNLSSKC